MSVLFFVENRTDTNCFLPCSEADGVELLSEDETDKLKSFCVWSQTARQDRRSEAVMAKIFLSYRREDSAGVAGRIYDRLPHHFGPDSVFIDIDSVPLWDNWCQFCFSLKTELTPIVFCLAPRPTALSCCPKMRLISLNHSVSGLRQLGKTDVARP